MNGKEERTRIGKEAYEKGHRFEEQVAELYRMLGFRVEPDRLIGGRQVDLVLRQDIGTMSIPFIVECKAQQVTMDDVDRFLNILNNARQEDAQFLGIIVSNTGFARNCREAAKKAGVNCVLFSDLSRSLIDFTAYVKHLVDDFKGSELAELYIEPCIRREEKEETEEAGEFLDQWLGTADARQITLLGDYGTGKTTLARKLAHDLGKKHLEDPTQPVPVLINLREGKSSLGLENLVIHHLQVNGMERASLKAFSHLLEQGFIVLIFDGFDEMVTRTNARLTLENLRELNRAVTGRAKVMLTCRTHYFRDTEEEKRLIGGDHVPGVSEGSTDLYREISNRPEFKIVYLREFTENQVKEYFNKIFGDAGTGNYEKMKGIYNLEKLSKRPVLLDMIVKSLGRMAADKKTLRPAELYDAYTRLWVDRNDWRSVLIPEEKMVFVEELAALLWEGEQESLHYRELHAVLKSHFSETIQESMELEFADYEVRTATFLQRDQEGNYRFSHRSFMEFFLAKRIIRNFKDRGIDALALRRLSPEVLGFLIDLIMDKKQPWIKATEDLLTCGYTPKTSENAFLLLVTLYRKSDPGSPVRLPKGVKLPDAELSGTGLEDIILHQADLRGAKLGAANLSGSDLSHSDLADSVLISADLSRVKLDKAVLKGSDCSGAQMKELDLRGMDLQDCRFRAADLSGCDLTEARLNRIDLSNVNLEGAYLCGADLTEADLTAAYLVRADFTNACLENTNFNCIAFKDATGLETLKKQVPWGSSTGTSLEGLALAIVRGHNDMVTSVCFSPDGRWLASASLDHTVKLWDAGTGSLLRTLVGHSGSVYSVCFSADGRCLASASHDHTVKLWDAGCGGLLRTLEGHYGSVNGVSFSTDGRWLASASDDYTVTLWDARTGELLRTLEGHSDGVNSVSFSTDGRCLASASSDRAVKLWDAGSGSLLRTLKGHSDSVNSVSFSADGRFLASASSDKTVKLWDAGTGSLLRTLEVHSGSVYSASFSADCRFLSSASSDHTVKLWDAGSGALMRTLEGHSNVVNSVCFSPDGRRLASASDDDTVKLWDVNTGKCLVTLFAFDAHTWIAYTPEKFFTCSDNAMSRIQFVENLAVYPAREFEKEFRRPEKIREILQRQSKQPRRH